MTVKQYLFNSISGVAALTAASLVQALAPIDNHEMADVHTSVVVCNEYLQQNPEQYKIYFTDSTYEGKMVDTISSARPIAEYGNCTDFPVVHGQKVYLHIETNNGLLPLIDNQDIVGQNLTFVIDVDGQISQV